MKVIVVNAITIFKSEMINTYFGLSTTLKSNPKP
jgi:hypothetical protein